MPLPTPLEDSSERQLEQQADWQEHLLALQIVQARGDCAQRGVDGCLRKHKHVRSLDGHGGSGGDVVACRWQRGAQHRKRGVCRGVVAHDRATHTRHGQRRRARPRRALRVHGPVEALVEVLVVRAHAPRHAARRECHCRSLRRPQIGGQPRERIHGVDLLADFVVALREVGRHKGVEVHGHAETEDAVVHDRCGGDGRGRHHPPPARHPLRLVDARRRYAGLRAQQRQRLAVDQVLGHGFVQVPLGLNELPGDPVRIHERLRLAVIFGECKVGQPV
eukprot:scaffold8718_cov159-Isochrysis_galbana.AAC.5